MTVSPRNTNSSSSSSTNHANTGWMMTSSSSSSSTSGNGHGGGGGSSKTMPKRIIFILVCITVLGAVVWMQLTEEVAFDTESSISSTTTTNTASIAVGAIVDRSSSTTWEKIASRPTMSMGEVGDNGTTITTTASMSMNNGSNITTHSSSLEINPSTKSINNNENHRNATISDDSSNIIGDHGGRKSDQSANTTASFGNATATSDELYDSSYILSSDEDTKKATAHVHHQTVDSDDNNDVAFTNGRTANQELLVPFQNYSNINNNPVQQIILLGERHSGTNWITDYLTECFDIKVSNEYTRFKHWFQSEDLIRVPEQSAVVIVMFRDPYDWVEAMRVEPHHAHDHLQWFQPFDPAKKIKEMAKPMKWKEFVTKPWIGRRGKHDKKIRQREGGVINATCMDRYSYVDAAPCSAQDSPYVKGLGEYKYEYQHDGSERGFPSIIDLRRDKINNMLSVADFLGTREFFQFRYEELNWNGTFTLLRSVEEATGLKAKCNATLGKAHRRQRILKEKVIRKHDELPKDYIQWMNRYVDWEVEGKIGYSRRGGVGDIGAKVIEGDSSLMAKEDFPMQTTTPVQQIILLGERHSGTNWITDYLTECFNITVSFEYKRFKHWFQEEDLTKVPEQSAVVVAMFRDPYDWVEAMRVYPHHSHDHLHWLQPHLNISMGWQQMANPLGWKAFVTKPWIGRRGPKDKEISKSRERMNSIICMDNYTFVDAAPCTVEDSPYVKGLGQYKYEYQHDGSERGFSSIIDLRREKIKNMLSVADFRSTRAFLPFRYEDLDVNGTDSLLRSVEEATGLKATCNATIGKAITTYNELPNDYIRWMNQYVDWDVESRIGYSKRRLNG